MSCRLCIARSLLCPHKPSLSSGRWLSLFLEALSFIGFLTRQSRPSLPGASIHRRFQNIRPAVHPSLHKGRNTDAAQIPRVWHGRSRGNDSMEQTELGLLLSVTDLGGHSSVTAPGGVAQWHNAWPHGTALSFNARGSGFNPWLPLQNSNAQDDQFHTLPESFISGVPQSARIIQLLSYPHSPLQVSQILTKTFFFSPPSPSFTFFLSPYFLSFAFPLSAFLFLLCLYLYLHFIYSMF